MAPLEGRVFSRVQQFAALPEELRDEVKALEEHLTKNKSEVFGLHHASILTRVQSIRHKPLIDYIAAWLKDKDAPPAPVEDDASGSNEEEKAETPAAEEAPAAEAEAAPAEAAPTEEAPAAEAPPAEAEAAPEAAPAEAEAAPAEATAEAPAEESAEDAEAKAAAAKAEEEAKAAAAKAEEEAKAAAAKAEAEATAARLAHAKELLDGLVLKGYITPTKDKLETTTPPLPFGDRELFLPLAPDVKEFTTLSVWDLVDGATFAGSLKRKAGFLAPLTQGKDTYAVINERLKSLTLFDVDVGREPIAEFAVGAAEDSPKVQVAVDNSHYTNGVKVWTDAAVEMLNVASEEEGATIVAALEAVGFTKYVAPEPAAPEAAPEAAAEAANEAAAEEAPAEAAPATEEAAPAEAEAAAEETPAPAEEPASEPAKPTEEAAKPAEDAPEPQQVEAAAPETEVKSESTPETKGDAGPEQGWTDGNEPKAAAPVAAP